MTSWESEVEAAQAEAAEAAEATEILRLIPPSHLRGTQTTTKNGSKASNPPTVTYKFEDWDARTNSFKKAKFLTFGVVCWISADLNMES